MFFSVIILCVFIGSSIATGIKLMAMGKTFVALVPFVAMVFAFFHLEELLAERRREREARELEEEFGMAGTDAERLRSIRMMSSQLSAVPSKPEEVQNM